MTSDIHQAAATGFEKEADRYQRGRPDYPAGVAGWLSESLALKPGKTVIDLGAGTGRFTRWLLDTGATPIAVEPVAAMRAQLQQALPEVTTLQGTATSIPLPDDSVDVVVCAQAFHWFSTGEALKEIRRILKPGGKLGLIWNVRNESVPWVAELTEIVARHEGDTPRYASGAWRKLFPADGYGPLEEAVFPHTHEGTVEQVMVDRTLSVSFIAALPAAEKERVAQEVRALASRTPELAGKEEIVFPYQTHAFHCVKNG